MKKNLKYVISRLIENKNGKVQNQTQHVFMKLAQGDNKTKCILY